MAKEEKKLLVEFEKQGYNMCTESSFVMIAKFFKESFDMDKNGKFNQWDVPLIEAGECTIYWDIMPCMNKILDCEMKEHRNIADLKAQIDEGMPTMIRIRPRFNLPGETHTIVVVGYKGDDLLIHDPAVGAYQRYSEKQLLKEWRDTKHSAIMCKAKK
jgi:hypothetical protein